jgi:hypothetical protein
MQAASEPNCVREERKKGILFICNDLLPATLKARGNVPLIANALYLILAPTRYYNNAVSSCTIVFARTKLKFFLWENFLIILVFTFDNLLICEK